MALRPRHWVAALVLGAAMTARPGAARADEIDDLLSGRDAFLAGDPRRAWTVLRPVVAAIPTTPRLGPVASVARKFYAAALYADRREPEARAALADLLREDPTARLETAQFEPGFVQLFDQVSHDLRPELERLVAAREQARLQAELQAAARRALGLRLLTEETRVERTSRLTMFLPFGIGQFANRQTGLGVMFLTVEAMALAGALTTELLYDGLYNQALSDYYLNSTAVTPERRAEIERLYTGNLISMAVFAAAYLAGVIQANLAYEPVRTTTVPRPLPPSLQGMQLSVGAGPLRGPHGNTAWGGTLRLTF